MPTLYEIGAEMAALNELLAETGGEITDAEAEAAIDMWLAENQTALERKVDGYCALIANFEAGAEIAEAEEKYFKGLAQSRRNNARRLKERLKCFFESHGIKKLQTARFTPRVQANGGALPLIVPEAWEREPASAPEQFHKIVIALDKEAIREAVRNDDPGAAGCAIGERGTHLRVR